MIEVMMKDPAGVILTTAGKKCNQNIKVVPGFDIPEEYDGAYELLVPTVSGVWVFNEKISCSWENEAKSFKASFTSFNKSFSYIEVASEAPDGLYVLYSYTTAGSGDVDVYENGILYEAYKTIDFGTEPQEVSEEFLAWLTANAVKQ